MVDWSNGATGPTVSDLPAGEIIATITDENNCSIRETYLIIAEDLTPPSISGRPMTVALGSNGTITISADELLETSNDNCTANISVTADIQTFTCDNLGDNLVTLTAVDDAGNLSTTTAVVTVIDDMSPTISCPDPIQVNACEASVDFADAIATDNCSASIMQTEGPAAGATFTEGQTLIEFTATDDSGNATVCDFLVILTSDLEITNLSTNNVDCITDGSAEIAIGGGNNNPQVTWSTGETGNSISDLQPGDYTVTVREDGCVLTSSFTVDDLRTMPEATVTVTANDDGTGSGSVTGSASNGDAPFTYIWTDANGNIVSTTADATGLAAGEYTLMITDANGCSGTANVVVDRTSSIAEQVFPGSFNVFPNPTTDFLNLEIELNLSLIHISEPTRPY